MSTPTPEVNVWNNLIMAFWAFGGATMRGMNDWNNPTTGKFSLIRMLTGLFTAAVLGNMALAATLYMNIDIRLCGALAAILGYIGPAATAALISKRFGVKQDGSGDNSRE